MSAGKLPEGWVETNLQNVASWGSGGTPSRNHDEYYNGNIPWIKTGDLGPKIITNASEYITDAGVQNSSAKFFPKGSVAIAMYGATIGKTSILGIDATTNQACAVGTPLEGITSTLFLYYFLLNEKNAFIKKGKGGAQPNISQTVIKEHIIYLPPLAEQKIITEKIDALLAQVDSTKARLEQIPQILKRFRQAVLNHCVISNFQEPKIKLLELTSKIGSGSTPKGGNDNYKLDGIPFVRSLNIHTHFIKYEDLAYIDVEQAKKLNNVVIHEKDVLLNITGASIGRVNIAPDAFIGGRVNQHVAIIRCQQSKILPEYLHIYMASPYIQRWIQGENYGATRQALTKKMLEELLIIVPPIKTQHEIVRRVEQLFAYADTIEKQVNNALARVNNLTQSILAKAFRGELTAQWRAENPDLISGENSAAALLEKIKAERTASGGKKASRKKS
ncbi:restriction endonuclease subunit S [Escherichia marmotae]|nr:restriction endonuclease subunit S [Escherichia marmotae]MED9483456.1 restriction endonuclease subunit S [Escherichia marmotae]